MEGYGFVSDNNEDGELFGTPTDSDVLGIHLCVYKLVMKLGIHLWGRTSLSSLLWCLNSWIDIDVLSKNFGL